MTDGTNIGYAGWEGRTERPMQLGMVYGPPVKRVEDGCLVYLPCEREKKKIGTGLLQNFLGLAGAPETEVIKYARKWGILDLAEDGLPCRSDAKRDVRSGNDEEYCLEPIALWYRFAGRLRSLVRIAGEINQGRPGGPDDWGVAAGYRFDVVAVMKAMQQSPGATRVKAALLDIARTELQTEVRYLIERCKVRPRFWWNKDADQWQIDLDAEGMSNLPGLLAIQLVITIANKEGYAMCSSCHTAYVPERKPDPTRRNYCGSCGIRAAWRDASRERRRRKREERERG